MAEAELRRWAMPWQGNTIQEDSKVSPVDFNGTGSQVTHIEGNIQSSGSQQGDQLPAAPVSMANGQARWELESVEKLSFVVRFAPSFEETFCDCKELW